MLKYYRSCIKQELLIYNDHQCSIKNNFNTTNFFQIMKPMTEVIKLPWEGQSGLDFTKFIG